MRVSRLAARKGCSYKRLLGPFCDYLLSLTCSTSFVMLHVSIPGNGGLSYQPAPSARVAPHSQTFEKRSSLAAKPVAGFPEAVLTMPTPGVTGAALLHPPNSSSAATVGFAGVDVATLKPPFPPGIMLWFPNEPLEPQPKSFEVLWDGAGLEELV